MSDAISPERPANTTEILLRIAEASVPVALGWDDIITFKWGDAWLPLFEYVSDEAFLHDLRGILKRNAQYAKDVA